jgi:hypothetical protein
MIPIQLLILFIAAVVVLSTNGLLIGCCVPDGYDFTRGHSLFGTMSKHLAKAGNSIAVLSIKLFLSLQHRLFDRCILIIIRVVEVSAWLRLLAKSAEMR